MPSADISKCGNKDCPSRKNCKRFMVPAHAKQSWLAFAPEAGKDRCDDYLPWKAEGRTSDR